MAYSSTGTRALLVLIAVVVGFAALKVTQPITLPLAFATVLLLFFRPLQVRLDRRLPRWVSPLVIMLMVLGLLALGALAVAYGVSVVAPEVPRLAEQIRPQLEALRGRLQSVGVSLPSGGSGSGGASGAAGGLLSGLGSFVSAVGVAVLSLTTLAFLLVEVKGYRKKLERGVLPASDSEKVLDAFSRMTGKFARYFLVQTFSSVVTGVLTGLYCWLIGIEFPFVWGLLTTVLNFIPTVGSIVAVVPPTLFALAFGGLDTAALAFVGLSVIQFTMGNVVDPVLQGRAIQVSETVVLLSVVFWGWLWGIGGAFIAVPLTIAVVLLCSEFEPTRPLAEFLSKPQD
jgi:AI-2 transport protein TqsA